MSFEDPTGEKLSKEKADEVARKILSYEEKDGDLEVLDNKDELLKKYGPVLVKPQKDEPVTSKEKTLEEPDVIPFAPLSKDAQYKKIIIEYQEKIDSAMANGNSPLIESLKKERDGKIKKLDDLNT